MTKFLPGAPLEAEGSWGIPEGTGDEHPPPHRALKHHLVPETCITLYVHRLDFKKNFKKEKKKQDAAALGSFP